MVSKCFNNSLTTYMQRKQDNKKTQTSKAQLSHTASCSFSTHLLFWSSHAIICCFSLPSVIFFCGMGHSRAHKYTYMTSSLEHYLLVSPCTCHAFAQFALPSRYINIESSCSLSTLSFTHSRAIVLHQQHQHLASTWSSINFHPHCLPQKQTACS